MRKSLRETLFQQSSLFGGFSRWFGLFSIILIGMMVSSAYGFGMGQPVPPTSSLLIRQAVSDDHCHDQSLKAAGYEGTSMDRPNPKKTVGWQRAGLQRIAHYVMKTGWNDSAKKIIQPRCSLVESFLMHVTEIPDQNCWYPGSLSPMPSRFQKRNTCN